MILYMIKNNVLHLKRKVDFPFNLFSRALESYYGLFIGHYIPATAAERKTYQSFLDRFKKN